jgi:hypothetical protein
MMVTADHTAGRIVASEHAGGPGQIPSRGEQQRDWPRQRRARTVRGKIGFGQRPDGEVAPPPIRQTLLERVIDLPWHTGSVQNQDLCALGDLPVPAGPPNSHCRHRACRHARSGDASRYRPRSAPPRRASPPERIPEVVGADLRAGRGDGSTEVHGRPPPDVARIDFPEM